MSWCRSPTIRLSVRGDDHLQQRLSNELGLGAGKDLNYIETYQGKLIDAKGVKGRYVRLYSNGNTTNKLNHYIEVEVWGKPAA